MSAHTNIPEHYRPHPWTHDELAKHTVGFRQCLPSLLQAHRRRMTYGQPTITTSTTIPPNVTRYDVVTDALVKGIRRSFPCIDRGDENALRQARVRLDALFCYEALLREDPHLTFREFHPIGDRDHAEALFTSPDHYGEALAHAMHHEIPLEVAYVHLLDHAHSD